MAVTGLTYAQKNQSELASYLSTEAAAGRVLMPSGLGLNQLRTRGFSVSPTPSAAATGKLYTVLTAVQDGRSPSDVSVYTDVLPSGISTVLDTELTAGRQLAGSFAQQTLYGQSTYTLVFYKFYDTARDTVLRQRVVAADLDPTLTVSNFFPANFLLKEAYFLVRTPEATSVDPRLYVTREGGYVLGAAIVPVYVGGGESAYILGTQSETFNVQTGVNDSFVLNVDDDQNLGTPAQVSTTTLTTGAAQTAQDIADDINAQLVLDSLDALVVASDDGGRLRLTYSNGTGLNYFQVNASSTCEALLGLDNFIRRANIDTTDRVFNDGAGYGDVFDSGTVDETDDLVVTAVESDFADLVMDIFLVGLSA